jgi:hypothetical protein
MRFRHAFALFGLLAAALASPLHAQRGAIDLTADLLDRFLRGYDAEQAELTKVDPQIKELDDKIRKFRDCRIAWEIAAAASGSAVVGLAAGVAIRVKCGATNESGFVRDRERIQEGPEKAAMTAGAFARVDDYRNLKYALMGYLHGGRSGFTKSGLDLLATRESEVSTRMGIPLYSFDAAPRSSGVAMPGVWTMDYAWIYIGQLFAVQYMSGATIFEKVYTPGQWTKWEMTTSDNPSDKQTMERAFIGKTSDGSEWWRLKTVVSSGNSADTVIVVAWFKPQGESMTHIVRRRG